MRSALNSRIQDSIFREQGSKESERVRESIYRNAYRFRPCKRVRFRVRVRCLREVEKETQGEKIHPAFLARLWFPCGSNCGVRGEFWWSFRDSWLWDTSNTAFDFSSAALYPICEWLFEPVCDPCLTFAWCGLVSTYDGSLEG